jgi:hypothetical protein
MLRRTKTIYIHEYVKYIPKVVFFIYTIDENQQSDQQSDDDENNSYEY